MNTLEETYAQLDPESYAVLHELWEFAKSVEPRATEGYSYGYPALQLNNRPLVGFSVAKEHMSVYPFSPKVIQAMHEELQEYSFSKGVIRFSVSQPFSKSLLEVMMRLRIEELTKK